MFCLYINQSINQSINYLYVHYRFGVNDDRIVISLWTIDSTVNLFFKNVSFKYLFEVNGTFLSLNLKEKV